MKKQFAVIGLGGFGAAIVSTLARKKVHVVAIDIDENKVRRFADIADVAVQLDATDENALKEAGVESLDAAVVCIGRNVEKSILAVMVLRQLGIEDIIAKAGSQQHARILSMMNVKKVVYADHDMGIRIANTLLNPDVVELLENHPGYSIAEVSAPETTWGKTIEECHIRTALGVTILAIRRPTQPPEENGEISFESNVNPAPAETIKEGDRLVLLGATQDIAKLG